MKFRRSRTRRLIIRVILFLFFGAIINVAVAWGFAYWKSSYWIRKLDIQELHATVRDRFPKAYIDDRHPGEGGICVALGVERTFERIDTNWLRHTFYQVSMERAGFPCLSVSGERLTAEISIPLSTKNRNSDCVVHAISLSQQSRALGRNGMLLPLEPVWPGFAINTLFYAVLLWLPFAFFGFVKRRRRMKRGVCPVCAYPVGTSEVCTECGRLVIPSTIEAAL